MPIQGAFLGLICGVTFSWFALSSIRYVGTLIELQWINTCLAEEDKINKEPKPALTSLRDTVDATIIGDMHRQYDPLNSPIRAQIAKLRILTEHPYAITQGSVDNGVRGAFRQPDVRKFLEESADLTAFIKEAKFSHLIESSSVKTLGENPAVQEVLLGVDIPKALGIQPEAKEKEPKARKEPEKPADPNAPAPGSARIF